MNLEEQKHFDWIKRVYGDWEEHKFMIQMVEIAEGETAIAKQALSDVAKGFDRTTAEVERLKAENDRLIANPLDRHLYKQMEGQVARYREALEYYANKEVYRQEYTTRITYITPIEKDKGARAREALKEKK